MFMGGSGSISGTCNLNNETRTTKAACCRRCLWIHDVPISPSCIRSDVVCGVK